MRSCQSTSRRLVGIETSRRVSSPQPSALRIRTRRSLRGWAEPSPIEEVFAFCDNLLGQPHCEPVRPAARHWAIFTRICLEAGINGPRISDAWFAALAIERGCVFFTFDRDYARFREFDWREPAA